MSNILDISSHQFSSSDRLFYDTNVWIALYLPELPALERAAYSQAHKQALARKSRIFVATVVMTEFVNRAELTKAKFAFAGTPLHSKRLNEQRNHPDFRAVASDVSGLVRLILRNAEWMDESLSSTRCSLIARAYRSDAGNPNFNDRILAHLCRKRRLSLVTHDSDFQNQDVNLLTAHPDLLSSAQSGRRSPNF